jgi:hypothetical protein
MNSKHKEDRGKNREHTEDYGAAPSLSAFPFFSCYLYTKQNIGWDHHPADAARSPHLSLHATQILQTRSYELHFAQ